MTKRTLQITNENEPVKAHFIYDVNNRLVEKYEAREDAANGTPCVHTKYEYDGLSSRIVNKREAEGAWNSAWDLA